MAQYTVKSYDDRGRLVGRSTFLALDDVEAQIALGQLADQRRKELWRGPRLVCGVPSGSRDRRMAW